MLLLDFILNIVGLLLWLNWCSLGFASIRPRPSVSIVQNLKRAEPRSARRWPLLVGLAVLLVGRAVLYHQLGSSLRWLAQLDLGVIEVLFRSEFVGQMFLFSVLGFVRVVIIFYSWLLLLSVVNARLPEADPAQRLFRAHLGRLEFLPAALKLVLPWVLVMILWAALHPVLARLGSVPATISAGHRWQQGLLIGISAILCWKHVLITALLLHVMASYVYFGESPFWKFVEDTGRNLLRPLAVLPLRAGRIDIAPVIGLGLIWGLTVLIARALKLMFDRLPW